MKRISFIALIISLLASCQATDKGHPYIPILNDSPERIAVIDAFPEKQNLEEHLGWLVRCYDQYDYDYFVDSGEKSKTAIAYNLSYKNSFEEGFAQYDTLWVAIAKKDDLAKRRNFQDFTLTYWIYKYTIDSLNDLDWFLIYPTKMGVNPIEMYYSPDHHFTAILFKP